MSVVDLRTLVIASGVVALALLALLHGLGTRQEVPAGFRSWRWSQGALALGTGLLALRGRAPSWASIVVANTLLVAAIALVNDGFLRFYGVRRRAPAGLDAVLIGAVAAVLLLLEEGSVNARIVVTGSASALFMVRTALEPLAASEAREVPAQRVLTGVLLGGAVLLLVRAGWAAVVPGYGDVWREGWTSFVPGVPLLVVNVTAMFVALYLTVERAAQRLSRAQADVRTLSGLLPICAHCHKIREDSGYWARLEQYISDRSGAQFTHCVCPECLERLYPGA